MGFIHEIKQSYLIT